MAEDQGLLECLMAPVDSENDSKPQNKDTSQNSNSESDPKTFADIDSTPKVRKGLEERKVNLPMFVT